MPVKDVRKGVPFYRDWKGLEPKKQTGLRPKESDKAFTSETTKDDALNPNGVHDGVELLWCKLAVLNVALQGPLRGQGLTNLLDHVVSP